MKVCTACGETYRDDIDFCFKDGEVLNAVGDAPAPSTGESQAAPVPQGEQTISAAIPGPDAKRALLNRPEAEASPPPSPAPEPQLVSPSLSPGADDDDDEDDEDPPGGAAFSQADTIPIPRRSHTPTPSGPRPGGAATAKPAPRPAAQDEEEDGLSKMMLFSVAGVALVLLLGGGTAIALGLYAYVQSTPEPIADVVPATPELDDPFGDPIEAIIGQAPAPSAETDAAIEDEALQGGSIAAVTRPAPRPSASNPAVAPQPELTSQPAASASQPAAPSPQPAAPAPSAAPEPSIAKVDPPREPAPAQPAAPVPAPAPAAPAPAPTDPQAERAPTTEAAMAAPPPEPAIGAIRIRSTPSGAHATIAGEEVGMTPVLVELPVGTHEVTLKLTGYDPLVQQIEVKAGKSELPAWPLERTVSTGTVPVMVFYDGRIGDDLYVDGTLVGKLPTRLELTEGEHRFAVKGPQGEDIERAMTVAGPDGGGVTFIHLSQ